MKLYVLYLKKKGGDLNVIKIKDSPIASKTQMLPSQSTNSEWELMREGWLREFITSLKKHTCCSLVNRLPRRE